MSALEGAKREKKKEKKHYDMVTLYPELGDEEFIFMISHNKIKTRVNVHFDENHIPFLHYLLSP